MTSTRMLLAGLTLLAALPMTARAEEDRMPHPSPDEIKAARKSVKTTCKKELAQRDPESRSALALSFPW